MFFTPTEKIETEYTVLSKKMERENFYTLHDRINFCLYWNSLVHPLLVASFSVNNIENCMA